MDRLKTFLKYALWIIGFFILSEILINVGLNSTYKDIERKDENTQINIYQAQATMVNGRMRGIITNNGQEDLRGKYIEINFYSKRDVFLGRKYIQIQENIEGDKSQAFELYFKLNNVSYYDIKITDEKQDSGEIELLPKDLTKPEIIFSTIAVMLIAM